MPPRKSNASQVAAPSTDETTPAKERDGVNIEDLSLPRTMVQRLAKGVLPSNTQIQKDALTAMSKAATVFVNYLSQAANTTAAYSTRKTIAPDAVIDALNEIEFADFVPRVEAELKRFNEVQTGKRNEYRRKLKEKETDKGDGDGVGPPSLTGGDGEERAAKRVRREEGFVDGGNRGVSGAARETQRGKEDEDDIDSEAEEQQEDVDADVDVTEEFDAEPETGGADDDDTQEEEEEEEGDEEEDNKDDENDESLSGEEQDEIDVDDADLHERGAARRGRGADNDDNDDNDDDDEEEGTSSASEGGSSS